jgi:hypothetical protein
VVDAHGGPSERVRERAGDACAHEQRAGQARALRVQRRRGRRGSPALRSTRCASGSTRRT